MQPVTFEPAFRDRTLELDEVLHGLVDDGFISPEQRDALLLEAEATTQHPLAVVADKGWPDCRQPTRNLDLETLTRWLADRVGLPYERIDPLKIDVAKVTASIKHAYASRFNILPIAIDGNHITIATCEPYVREWESELSQSLSLTFSRVIANPLSVRRYLDEFYAVGKSLAGAEHDRRTEPVSAGGNLEQLIDLSQITEPDANDQHIVRIVDWLLQYAFEQRASDIHVEPRRDIGNIRFRIDGVLHVVNKMPLPVLGAVISRLKALGRMDVVERRRPQDGRIKTRAPSGREVELRLSTMPITFGEKIVLRIFDPDVLVKPFSELGFNAHDESRWQDMVSQPHGMVVVTGPTGSGKTTTLYSALKHLARPEQNVCTIEDPIEPVDPGLNQMQVQPNIGLTFASGVRTLLRQDPDIIMVGEIRDAETAETAIQAALTGHLVLSTLHTNDAPSSVTRFLDLGVAPYLIKSSLLGVLAQRLVRTLCPSCKTPSSISDDEWSALTLDRGAPKPDHVFAAVGCDDCRNTGFRGRSALVELMVMSDSLRESVVSGFDWQSARELAIEEGMVSLRQSGAEHVRRGDTTPEEVHSVVPDD
ncbi:MAG: ATPase, T2SS/T4P/T4SS family [Pseudomonadota bacterium]